MTATCHSGHAAPASERAARPAGAQIRVDAIGRCPETPTIRGFRSRFERAPETQWRRVHGLPGLAARIGTGDLHALDRRDHHRLRAHGRRRLSRRHVGGRGRQASHGELGGRGQKHGQRDHPRARGLEEDCRSRRLTTFPRTSEGRRTAALRSGSPIAADAIRPALPAAGRRYKR